MYKHALSAGTRMSGLVDASEASMRRLAQLRSPKTPAKCSDLAACTVRLSSCVLAVFRHSVKRAPYGQHGTIIGFGSTSWSNWVKFRFNMWIDNICYILIKFSAEEGTRGAPGMLAIGPDLQDTSPLLELLSEDTL